MVAKAVQYLKGGTGEVTSAPATDRSLPWADLCGKQGRQGWFKVWHFSKPGSKSCGMKQHKVWPQAEMLW